jgi:hypothetical protein
MTIDRRKLLQNQSVGLSIGVTNVRLKKAGVVLESDLKLNRKSSTTGTPYGTSVTKKLAGG